MALQGSGAISLANLASEFGGAAPHALSEYYRNGGLVGSNNTNVPTSGQISLSQFYGATAYVPMSLSKSGEAYGYCLAVSPLPPTSCRADTNAVTVSVSGGTGPYTYAWSWVSGVNFSTIGGSTATASFWAAAQTTTLNGVKRCTVTDATSATAYIDVNVQTAHEWESNA